MRTANLHAVPQGRLNLLNLAQDASPISANLRDALLQNPHKIVILSEAPHRFYRVNSVWGAESKDPDDAYLVDAARTFSTTQTREHDSPLRLLMLLSAKIQVAGDAKLKRACMAAQDVNVAAVHSKTLPFLLSAPGKTVAVRQVRASVLERVPTAWVGQVARGSFDSAPQTLLTR